MAGATVKKSASELSQPNRVLRGGALGLHYVFIPPIITTLYFMLAFIWNLCHTEFVSANQLFAQRDKISGYDATIELLQNTDDILILTVASLTVFGTIWIYMLPPQLEEHLPSALQGLTSGKMKEKVASGLIVASAVNLFKIFLQLTNAAFAHNVTVSALESFAIYGGIHLLFVISYFVIAQSNRLDPHKQPVKSAPPSERPAH